MHPSKMRTIRCSGHWGGGGGLPGGGYLPRGMSAQGYVCLGGVYTSPNWTEFLTHACENITFPRKS